MLLTNDFNILLILWGSDCQQQQGARFIGLSRYFQRNPVRGLVKGIHIVNQPVVADVPFSDFMTDYRRRRWNGRVIRYTIGEIVGKVHLARCGVHKKRKDQRESEFLHRV